MTQKEQREQFKKEKLLLEPFLNNNHITLYNDLQLECYMAAMKEYAEFYARRCLETAFDLRKSTHKVDSSIFQGSIFDINLPPHD
jgi:hypothetical protein